MPSHTTISLSATRATQLKALAKAAKLTSATLVENWIRLEWKRQHPASDLPGFAFRPANAPGVRSIHFGVEGWPLLHLLGSDAIQLGHLLLTLAEDGRGKIDFATRSGDWVSCSRQGRGFSLALRITPKGQNTGATTTKGLSPELLRDLGEALIEAASK